MNSNIFMNEYKNIKEVDINQINNDLINVNHNICEAKKGLRCLKKIRSVQLKYRVFKRKKYNFIDISNMIIDEYTHAYNRLSDDSLSRKQMRDALNDFEIYAYELALINDESREYEYNPKVDEGIDIYKSDIKLLKKQRRRMVLNTIKTQISNIKTIRNISKIDEDTLNTDNEKRVLRRYLR